MHEPVFCFPRAPTTAPPYAHPTPTQPNPNQPTTPHHTTPRPPLPLPKKTCLQYVITDNHTCENSPVLKNGPSASTSGTTRGHGEGRDMNSTEGMAHHDPLQPPEFADASPATCTQACVDEAFGYFRPAGEVGRALPLPVQVRSCTLLAVDFFFLNIFLAFFFYAHLQLTNHRCRPWQQDEDIALKGKSVHMKITTAYNTTGS